MVCCGGAAALFIGGYSNFYLLYWYKITNTDAEARIATGEATASAAVKDWRKRAAERYKSTNTDKRRCCRRGLAPNLHALLVQKYKY